MNNRHFLRLLAVIAAILIAQQASAIVVPRANSDTFEIKSPVDKSKCVDCAQNKNGYQLRMWECNGTPNQQFRYTNGQIISVQSGLCLDVDQNNPHDWAKVQMYDCNGTGAQQWELKQSGGHYGVFLKGTNYVLNDLYRDTSQGALVGLYTIADGDLASLWDILYGCDNGGNDWSNGCAKPYSVCRIGCVFRCGSQQRSSQGSCDGECYTECENSNIVKQCKRCGY